MKIEVYSDYVCPFCYMGKVVLDAVYYIQAISIIKIFLYSLLTYV
ncbi:DsbA family protein [Calorimonas adulescens]|jgi:DSBA-like thioredoxin domain.|uniref:DSBA-like thioredoxin domain-containing protein n=1 Tax=Calorimonas adulescens TaxID=2606906 RepID=A0A5D8QEW9_9THEO|nr:hypothetical protein FWJ32_03170 [Calorimonas adulescens]